MGKLMVVVVIVVCCRRELPLFEEVLDLSSRLKDGDLVVDLINQTSIITAISIFLVPVSQPNARMFRSSASGAATAGQKNRMWMRIRSGESWSSTVGKGMRDE